jgi:F-type H+-transporting ATPase subunit gamma
MATMRDIRRRIRSVNSTQQITKAMKMVAAAKLRRAQDRLLRLRPYADRIEGMLDRLLPELAGDEHPLLEQRDPAKGKIALVLVTSDGGLCGGFNVNLIHTARAAIGARPADSTILSFIGRKGHDFFTRRGVKSQDYWRDIYDKLEISMVAQLTGRFVRRFTEGEIDGVSVCYANFVNAVTQKPAVQQLLPIDLGQYREQPAPESVPGAAAEPAEQAPPPASEINVFEPSLVEVCAELVTRRMAIAMLRCPLENIASEFAARMTAMENATNNATDMIDRLTLDLNRARQAQITKEISEIVGGAEAMRG